MIMITFFFIISDQVNICQKIFWENYFGMGDLYSENYFQTFKYLSFLNPFKYIYFIESFLVKKAEKKIFSNLIKLQFYFQKMR